MKDRTLALGELLITTNASNRISQSDIESALIRHQNCDWGIVDKHDWKVNDDAVSSGNDRVLSAYKAGNGTKFWIITEWDRSVTTVLLPEDY